MAQRHPHDDTIRLPVGHADPRSPQFVPIQLREAFAAIDEATENALKRKLWSEIKGSMIRTVGGHPVSVDPKSSDDDFAVALTWLKLDEAARRVSRDNQSRTGREQDQRIHTCKLCGRYDRTANTGNGVTADQWCEMCRDESRRQEVAEHAARTVNGKSVADLIAANREQVTT